MKSEDKPRPRRPRRKRDREAERVFEGLGVAPGIGQRRTSEQVVHVTTNFYAPAADSPSTIRGRLGPRSIIHSRA